MITIEKLLEDSYAALCRYFTKIVNGVKIEPDVYDHTDEIFDDNSPDVAVWCDINHKGLPWFNGLPNFIICCSNELGEGSIDLFIGDGCSNVYEMEKEVDCFDFEDVWHIEMADDFLMLRADFDLDSPDMLEELISEKLVRLFDNDFSEAIRSVAKYFE